MDLNQLTKINDYCWSVQAEPGTSPLPIQLYADQSLLETMDAKVLEQIKNVAQLPGLVGAAMTMPDAHWGYGFPIGGVAAFDPDAGGIISAGGVGFDISCGIRCLRTNLYWSDLFPQAEQLADLLYAHIPAGVGVEGKICLSPRELDAMLRGGAQWAVQQGFGSKEDLLFIEEQGKMAGAMPEHVSDLAKKRQRSEVGTLGSGNHYLEVQVVDKIHDPQAAQAYQLQEGLRVGERAPPGARILPEFFAKMPWQLLGMFWSNTF